ncbi:MAG: hypothetical protein V1779_17650 [bacterium]
MALVSPQSTDDLNTKDHAKLHRVIDVDSAAAEGSAYVDSNGDFNIASGKKYKINGSNLAAADVGAEPADADLSVIAGLSPSDDDIIQRKTGAWANRTMAQLKTDLALAKGDVGLGNVTNDAQIPKSLGTNQADIIYFSAASTPARLAKGTANQVLAMNAGATAPEWQDASGGGGDSKVFVMPGTGYLSGASLTTNNRLPNVLFADSQSQTWIFAVRIPTGYSSISSIQILYRRGSTGNLYINFEVGQTRFTAGFQATQDTSPGVATYAGGGSDDKMGIISLSSSFWDGLSTAEGDVIGLSINRVGNDANDTYNTGWYVHGVLFTFS